MSIDPTPTLKSFINQTYLETRPQKHGSQTKPYQSQIFKIASIKLSPHPSFMFKQQISKNLTRLKEQLKIRCVTRALIRPKHLTFNDSCKETLKSSRNLLKKIEEPQIIHPSRAILASLPPRPICHSTKNIDFVSPERNISIRKQPGHWLKYRNSFNQGSQDLFHCSRILGSGKIVSFYELLGIFYDSLTVFPYFNKHTKEHSKDFCSPVKVQNSVLEDQLSVNKKFGQKRNLAITNQEKKLIPSLESRFYSPQQVIYKANIIIINFESISIKNSTKLHPSIINVLLQASGLFHLILVSSIHNDPEEIICELNSLYIKISAFYVTVDQSAVCKFLDYSKIFEDFQVVDPLKSCLLISHHSLFEWVKEEECVASEYGAKIKLNCEKLPVFMKEYCSAPVVVLIQRIDVGESELLEELLEILVEGYMRLRYFCEVDFFAVFSDRDVRVLESRVHLNVFKKYLGLDETLVDCFSLAHMQYFIV